MSFKSRSLTTLGLVWLLGLMVALSAQAPNRIVDKEMKPLLEDLEKHVKKFQDTAKDKLKGTTVNTGSGDAAVSQLVADLRDAAKRIKDKYGDESTAALADDVFRRAGHVNRFMQANPLVTGADPQWAAVKGDLDRLAAGYGVTWSNEGSSSRPNRLSDEGLDQLLEAFQKTGKQFTDSMDKALSKDKTVDKKVRENIKNSLKSLTDTAGKLQDKAEDPDKKSEAYLYLGQILQSGGAITTFMESRSLPTEVKQGWVRLCGQLSAVAKAYAVTWPEPKAAPAPAAM